MILEIEIRNWAKYNPRSDVKSCSWFRMSNDFFSDPDFYGCSVTARVSWLFILSMASKKMASTIRVNTAMMIDSLKVTEETLANALHELEMTNAITVLDCNVKSIRSDSIVRKMLPSATNEQTDKRTNTLTASPVVISEVPKRSRKKNLPKLQSQDFRNSKDSPELFAIEAPQLEEDMSISQKAANVLTIFNSLTFKNFRPVPGNMKHINARLNEGYALDDFKLVIEYKYKQWVNNPEMAHNIRPETILGNKFDGYLQSAQSALKPKTDPLDDFFAQYAPQALEGA